MTVDPLQELRERLVHRTNWEYQDGELVKVPCYCAKRRNPCERHDAFEDGVDAVLTALEPVHGWMVKPDGTEPHRWEPICDEGVDHPCRSLYRISVPKEGA